MDRIHNTTDNVIQLVYPKTNEKFVDVNFPTADALYWKDAGETTADNEMWKLDAVGIEWVRVTELKRKKPGLHFWGPNAHVNDISP